MELVEVGDVFSHPVYGHGVVFKVWPSGDFEIEYEDETLVYYDMEGFSFEEEEPHMFDFTSFLRAAHEGLRKARLDADSKEFLKASIKPEKVKFEKSNEKSQTQLVKKTEEKKTEEKKPEEKKPEEKKPEVKSIAPFDPSTLKPFQHVLVRKRGQVGWWPDIYLSNAFGSYRCATGNWDEIKPYEEKK